MIIANAMPSRPGEMDDDQRKAMWAKRRGNGYFGGKKTAAPKPKAPKPFDPSKQETSVFKAAVKGFIEGASEGLQIVGNALSAGLTDKLNWTDTTSLNDTAHAWSKGLAATGSGILHGVAGGSIGTATLKGLGALGAKIAPYVPAGFASFVSKNQALLTAAGGLFASNEVAAYREENKTMNPYTDKALALLEQAALYTGASGVIGVGKKIIGAVGKAIPIGNGLTLTDGIKNTLLRVDKTLVNKATQAGAYVSQKNKDALKTVHTAYSKVADFTGNTIKAIPTSLKSPAKIAQANQYRSWASQITANPTSTAQDIVNANKLIKRAEGVEANVRAAMNNARYVTGGITAKIGHEEARATQYQELARKEFDKGKGYSAPVDTERGLLHAIAMVGTGSLGNPVEKQFRYGQENYDARTGIYRAQYDMIKETAAEEGWSKEKEQRALTELAENDKPIEGMAGKSLWSFAPAAVAFAGWKLKDAMSESRRSTSAKVVDVHDADTIKIDLGDGKGPQNVRFQGIDAPDEKSRESKQVSKVEHDLAVNVATPRLKELVGDKYVRFVKDSRQKTKFADQSASREDYPDDDTPIGVGLEKWDRPIGTVKTLPSPFDKILATPLGGIVPTWAMTDVGTKLVEEGLADIRYRELSKKTDTWEALDKARQYAQEQGTGIWTEESRAAIPWVGKEQTAEEWNKKLTAQGAAPESAESIIAQLVGSGLMYSGNSGAFDSMPTAGKITVQAWNLLAAAAGVAEYNMKARNAAKKRQKKYRPNKNIKTDYDKRMEQILGNF